MQVKLWRARLFFAFREDDQCRKQEHHAKQEKQNACSGEEAELRHAAKIGRQKRVEGARSRDRRHEDARHRRSHDRANRAGEIGAAVPFINVAAVKHCDEVDAQSGE